MIISAALVQGWPIQQLDVKNVFLHGNITEDIYIKQPPGMADISANYRRPLYGLKQALRAWFDRFSTFLLEYGFISRLSDKVSQNMGETRLNTHTLLLATLPKLVEKC